MLVQTWTREEPCPTCGAPLVWNIAHREYQEIRARLLCDPARITWAADCRCSHCDAALMAVITMRDDGLWMNLEPR